MRCFYLVRPLQIAVQDYSTSTSFFSVCPIVQAPIRKFSAYKIITHNYEQHMKLYRLIKIYNSLCDLIQVYSRSFNSRNNDTVLYEIHNKWPLAITVEHGSFNRIRQVAPTRVCSSPNGISISIGSSVFAGLIHVTNAQTDGYTDHATSRHAQEQARIYAPRAGDAA